MVALDLLSRAGDGFARRLARVQPDQWTAPTPCTEWDVQALVNHVVGANRRYTLLLHGATAGEVDATRTVDHLGQDPVNSFVTTAAALNAAFCEPGALARTAHHPGGERTGALGPRQGHQRRRVARPGRDCIRSHPPRHLRGRP